MNNIVWDLLDIFHFGGTSPVDRQRITSLENAQLQITHFQQIDISAGTTGSITFPAGSTLNEKALAAIDNSYLTVLDSSGNPLYETPMDGIGNPITANLDNAGNWVANTTSSDNIGLVYVVNVPRVSYDAWDQATRDGIIDAIQIDPDIPVSNFVLTGGNSTSYQVSNELVIELQDQVDYTLPEIATLTDKDFFINLKNISGSSILLLTQPSDTFEGQTQQQIGPNESFRIYVSTEYKIS